MGDSGWMEKHVVGQFTDGESWIAHSEERIQRASHALVGDIDGDDEAVWLVDPVDAAGLDERIGELGGLEGIIVLLDRHSRDAEAIARRHSVPVTLPKSMDRVAERFDAEIDLVETELPGTGLQLVPMVQNRFWHETALFRPETGTLVVPETVGTASYYRVGDERLGVHPMLRLRPPRGALRNCSPERVLVGHGTPILRNGREALADAFSGARRRAPRLYCKTIRDVLIG